MSHPELLLFAQRHQLAPPVFQDLSTVVSNIMLESMQRLRDVMSAAFDDAKMSELEGTFVDAIESMAQTLAPDAVGEMTPAPKHRVTAIESASQLQSVSPKTGGTMEAPEHMRSIFIDMDNDTFDGERISLHVEGEAEEVKRGELIGGEGSRYEDLGLLGVGGMGEVRRVRERDLNRTLAMKIIKPDVMSKKASLARFIEEAQVSAQLQHPSIIPVHELGRMPDGRYYFTMQEIRGREIDDAIKSVHEASQNGWQYDSHGWSLRQLITALQKACQAVGYAHARGVIHRDLKPSNIMVGRDGEVFVVDWGISKIKGHTTLANAADVEVTMIETDRSKDDSQSTKAGAVTGTPAYMPPEQAEGKLDQIGVHSDVYSLGAILYKILTGRIPYDAPNVWLLLMAVVKGGLKAPSEVAINKIPEELEEICVRALSVTPKDRYTDASKMAEELGAWLDGAKRREKALELVQAARNARLEGEEMLRRAEVLRGEGEALLEDVPLWAPEEDKREGWALEDEAKELEQGARLKGLEVTHTLHAALTYVPELPEAHETLATHYRDQHRQAEVERDQERARGEEVLLSTHVQTLPAGEARQGFATYLKGTGAVTLVTEPEGAEVGLYRYVTRHRRLVPELMRSLGRTPLIEIPLEMGSYLLEIRKDGHEMVRYPVFIERGQHCDGVRPGSNEPYPIVLPKQGTLDRNECYVPAGWFWAGGDPHAYIGWPRTRYWADAFVMQRFPVTNHEYITFLDDLVAQGREDEALQHVPREKGGTVGELGAMIYGRDTQGRFELRPDAEGDIWLPDEPVSMVDWYGAKAYAAWQSSQDRKRWRLAMEQEFEKAARGVDGRFYPWGDHLNPSWCCMRDSHQGQPLPSVVESYPIDVSVYGIRGLGGNMRDWCEDIYAPDAPVSPLVQTPALDQRDPEERIYRVNRGGAWNVTAIYCRAATRVRDVPSGRDAFYGVRLSRSYERRQMSST